jgi:hypothetical protein
MTGVIGCNHIGATGAVETMTGAASPPAYGDAFAALFGFFMYKAGRCRLTPS